MESKESSVKRCRTRFNSRQIQKLEQVFIRTHYPDTKQMERLSLQTEIPTHKMQIWFQNRRAKWRKNTRLRNFGGLASVKETEYVPAPIISDTFKSIYLDRHECNAFYDYKPDFESDNNAIDLSKASLSDSELSAQSVPTVPEIYEKSSAYKKSGGITSSRLNDHMNAFEYPTAYYSRHYIDNKKEMPSFAFASNQNMSSLLFAPTLVYNKPIHSGDEYDSDIQNTYINK